MTENPKKPDGFRPSTAFGILAALIIVVMSASAAGHYIFEDMPADTSIDLSSILTDDQPTEDESGMADLEDAESDDHQESIVALKGDDDTTAERSDVAAPQDMIDGIEERVVERVVGTLAREVATNTASSFGVGTSEQETDEDAPTEEEESSHRLSTLFSAVGDLWGVLFTKAWPFLKGFGTSAWNVLEQNSHYTPET